MNPTNLHWILIFSALLPWAAIAVAALITPGLTRPELFFSVTVNPSFRTSETGRDILRQYKRNIIIFALIALPPIAYLQVSPRLLMVGLLGPAFIELAGCFAAFLVARNRTLPHRVAQTSEREAEIAPRKASMPGGILGQVGPFLVLAVCAILLAVNWQHIPERFPIHYGADGRPNGWADKGIGSVFGVLLIGVLPCLLLFAIQYGITHGLRRINSSGSAGQRETRFVRIMSGLVLAIEYFMALLMGGLSLLVLRSNPQAPLPAFRPLFICEALIIAIVFALVYRTGQGGSRLPNGVEPARTDAPPVGDRTPDECWKLGMFYYNQNDPALLVEKRFGVGWTFNFARASAWWILGALLFFSLGGLIFALWTSARR